MTFKINDENWIRDNYVCPTKVPYTFITSGEKEGFKTQLWNRSNATESERLFIVGCALMVITRQGPGSQIICSWDSRDGTYIDLENSIYVTEYYLPENAAKESESDIFIQVDQKLELPIPHFIRDTIRDSEAFKGRDSISIKELLPSSMPHVWGELYKLLPECLLSGRKGEDFFRLWLATEISECSDKDVAHAVCQLAGFNSNHHTYYPTIKKSIVYEAWCQAIENIFCVALDKKVAPEGYVGSYVGIREQYLKKWLDIHYTRFPLKTDWRRFGKRDLINYYNELVIEGWLALSTNFALRRYDAKVIEHIFTSNHDQLIFILDKKVNKDHPERYIPMTELTRCCIQQLMNVAMSLRDKFAIKIDIFQLNIIDVNRGLVSPLDTKHINAALFGGSDVPVNVIRHYMASVMHELNMGAQSHTLLGHRPDKVHLPHRDILYSPANPEFRETILTIQSKHVGLRLRRAKCPRILEPDSFILNSLKKGKTDEALAYLWAFTKPLYILNLISKKGAKVSRYGEFNTLNSNGIFVDFLSDDELALLQGNALIDLKPIAKLACQIRKKQDLTRDFIDENIRKHIEYYSSRSNYLSQDCLRTMLQIPAELNTQSLKPSVKGLVIQDQSVCTTRLKSLIHKLSETHHNPIEILFSHLVDGFGMDNVQGDNVDELLDTIQLCSDTVEIAIYRYMYQKMLTRADKSKRQIAKSTWTTERSKVYLRILDHFKNVPAVSVLSQHDVAKFRAKLIHSVKEELSGPTITNIMHIVDGIFSYLGEDPVNFYTPQNKGTFPVPKLVIWPHQYLELLKRLKQLNESDSEQEIIDCAAVILMYKAGLRPSELTICEISDVVHISSHYHKRTKTRAGNRVIRCENSLDRDEQNILNNFCVIQHRFRCEPKRSSLFNQANISLIGRLLKQITGNHVACAYDLRRSFANFHYLLILKVDIPVVRQFFNTQDLNITMGNLENLWSIKGYEHEATLKALSLTMGHEKISTMMDWYICTLPFMRLYHMAKQKILKVRQIAKLLNLPSSTYHSYRQSNASGFALGSHLVKDFSSQINCWQSVQINNRQQNDNKRDLPKVLQFQEALLRKDARYYFVVIEAKRLFGFTEKELRAKIAHKMTQDIVKYLCEKGQSVCQEIYKEWIGNFDPRTRKIKPLNCPGFLELRDHFQFVYWVAVNPSDPSKYVNKGASMSRNKFIAAALHIMRSYHVVESFAKQ